ncbi:hypothetical protein [Natronorubrum daqingense]|uniref:Uncharacterized protein n=1 Tax=Natronorubrum daqingense TaxID=588898 RepID=A0A1N6ZKL4_9EURY|nr:hypothetical protein [Natronorubrum daqingense]APX95324.1 hypothetical protein BB347_01135 [Natronorubrum daqingense]SIR27355.1 hypothetical protein SAMN05421809_0833 [Natronorubrum daqingense]
MGLLELMLGQSGPGEQGVEGRSYKLPKDTHDFVYPVAVRRVELEGFLDLLEAEADAPSLEVDTDDVQSVFDEVLGEVDIDAEYLTERQRNPRQEARAVLDTWHEQVDDDIGIVYARPDTYPTLLSFVKRCKQRDDHVDDQFELPDTFNDGAALLKRLEEATDEQYRAVVHTDVLPPHP